LAEIGGVWQSLAQDINPKKRKIREERTKGEQMENKW
jgi:hypothetical protein